MRNTTFKQQNIDFKIKRVTSLYFQYFFKSILQNYPYFCCIEGKKSKKERKKEIKIEESGRSYTILNYVCEKGEMKNGEIF
jgi:hypothetical protein